MSAREVFDDTRVAELAEAAAAGDEARVGSLVADGVDPNARGMKGMTALMWVAFNGSDAGVRALLDVGADHALVDELGRTAVHLAAMAVDPRPMDVLLADGADPNGRDQERLRTPLAAAIRGDREAQLRLLLKAGADPQVVDRKGNTLLHLAGKLNATNCVVPLLEAGADPRARNHQDVQFLRYIENRPSRARTERASEQVAVIIAWLDGKGIGLDRRASGQNPSRS